MSISIGSEETRTVILLDSCMYGERGETVELGRWVAEYLVNHAGARWASALEEREDKSLSRRARRTAQMKYG